MLGSRSALTAPVIIGFGVTGFLLTLLFLRLTLGESWSLSIGISLSTAVVSGALLLLVSATTARWSWVTPRLGLVVGSIAVSSMVRSLAKADAERDHDQGDRSDIVPVVRRNTFHQFVEDQ